MKIDQIRHKVDQLGIHTEFAIRTLIEKLYVEFYGNKNNWEVLISEPVKYHMRTRLRENYEDLLSLSLYDFLECTSLGEAINILLDNYETFRKKLNVANYGELKKLLTMFRRDVRNDFIAHPKRYITQEDLALTLKVSQDIYNLCPEYMVELKQVLDRLFKEHSQTPKDQLALFQSLAITYHTKAKAVSKGGNWQEEFLDIALNYIKECDHLNYCTEAFCEVRDDIVSDAIKHYMNSEQSYKAMEWINYLLAVYEKIENSPNPIRHFIDSGYKMVYIYLNKSKTHFYTSRKSRLAQDKKQEELHLCHAAFERALSLYHQLAQMSVPYDHLTQKINQIKEKINYVPLKHKGLFSTYQPSLKGIYMDCQTCGQKHYIPANLLPKTFDWDELDYYIEDCNTITCEVLESYKTPFSHIAYEVAPTPIIIADEALQSDLLQTITPTEQDETECFLGTICEVSKNIVFLTRDGEERIFCHPNDIVNFRYLSHMDNREEIIYNWLSTRQQFKFSIIFNEEENRYEAINVQKLIFPEIAEDNLPPLNYTVRSSFSPSNYKLEGKDYIGTILSIEPNGTIGLTKDGSDSIFCHLNDIPELNGPLNAMDRNITIRNWYYNKQRFSFSTRFNFKKKRLEAFNVKRI